MPAALAQAFTHRNLDSKKRSEIAATDLASLDSAELLIEMNKQRIKHNADEHEGGLEVPEFKEAAAPAADASPDAVLDVPTTAAAASDPDAVPAQSLNSHD